MALQQINWLQIDTEKIPSGSQVILASETNPLEWVYTKNLFTSGGFIVSGSLDTSGDVVIGGNLTVKGTTTVIESNIVSMGDGVIELNGTLGSYGGLIVKDPTQPNTVSGSLLWDTINDRWIGGPLGSEDEIILSTKEQTITNKTIDADLNNIINLPNVTLTTPVTSSLTVGAITAGDVVPEGTNLQELTELLLNKTFYPTYVDPTFSLTNNGGTKEVGTTFTITATFNFDKGKILGTLSSGIWDEDAIQNNRAGTVNFYTINGINNGTTNIRSFSVTTLLGTNTITGSVTYLIGPQPIDSKNNPYGTPYPAGTSPTQSTTFTGIYPYFYYKSNTEITPTTMKNAIESGLATKVVGISTGTITIPFNANGEYIAVAYPASSTTKTKWYVNALDNGSIPGGVLGSVTTLTCNSPSSFWNNVSYKIHTSPGLITQANPIEIRNT